MIGPISRSNFLRWASGEDPPVHELLDACGLTKEDLGIAPSRIVVQRSLEALDGLATVLRPGRRAMLFSAAHDVLKEVGFPFAERYVEQYLDENAEGQVRESWVAGKKWETVLRLVRNESRHPSPEYLADLISRWGVPRLARGYVAGRVSGAIKCSGRPVPLPPSAHWPEEDFWESMSGLTPQQFFLLTRVRRRYACYVGLAMDRKPRTANLHSRWGWPPRLRYIASRSVWVVAQPKELARRHVARRYHVSTATLAAWEKLVTPLTF